MNEITKLLQHTVTEKASDLHISTGSPIMFRVNGSMKKLDDKPLNGEVATKLIDQILNSERKKELDKNHEIDFSLNIADIGRFRVNVFYQRWGLLQR